MKRLCLFVLCLFTLNMVIFSLENKNKIYEVKNVLVATYSGVIVPVAYEYINTSIDRLNDEEFDLLIIRLDTPGGLDSSMREIIKKMLSSKKPICVYIYPKGARAASAGVFITMASHIAAMSPSTNIGAAHPVMIGGGIEIEPSKKDDEKNKVKKSAIEEKVLNDAKAYIKSITRYKNRNVEWAVKAVTKSDSLAAYEALKMKVVEFVADDVDDLLKQINGFSLDGFGILKTEKITRIDYIEMTPRQKFLSTISDPNIAMILMSIGAIGIFIELYNPGLILPGVVGAVSLVIGLYALQTLSASFAGIVLILLGFLFFLLEIKIMSWGLLTLAGVISIFLGATMLFKSSPAIGGIGVNMKILLINLIGMLVIVFILAYIVLRVHMRKVTTGKEAMLGKRFVLKKPLKLEDKILIEGEWWDCLSMDGEIESGSMVEIVGFDGFKLKLKKVK